jgi:hypothetical protein
MEDLVTGAGTEVKLTVDLPPDRVLELVSDVTRVGEWSPECVRAAWTHPDRAADVITNRLAALRRNMTTTLTAMTGGPKR